MWLPMWVFDGKGLTMSCLAVRIRNVAPRLRLFCNDDAVSSGGCDGIQRLQSRISVATSRTDFSAPRLISQRSSLAGLCPGRDICHVGEAVGLRTALGPNAGLGSKLRPHSRLHPAVSARSTDPTKN